MSKNSKSAQIKKAILDIYPGWSLKRDRIEERSANFGIVVYTRVTLLTDKGVPFRSARYRNYEGAMENLAFALLIRIEG